MKLWFFPVWSGDFRLEADGSACKLTTEDLTPEDREKLIPFLATCRERGWAELEGDAIPESVSLSAPLSEVGPVLAGTTHGDKPTWTAVRFSKGTMLVDGVDISKADGVAAATVTPPRRGCPAPTTADRRAAQVLGVFSSRSQMDTWRSEGWMQVIGNHTGQLYRLFHRAEAAARRLPRLLLRWDGEPICVWDDRVPPAEETLSIKFAVEHREAWLLGLAS